MAVTKRTWNKEEGLWPASPFRPWFVPGGGPRRALDAWGVYEQDGVNFTLDIGAMRLDEREVWLVFMPRGWEEFDPSNASHRAHANRFSRYGAGHSFGEGLLNGHSKILEVEIKARWAQVFGGRPTTRDISDVGFNEALAAQLGLTGAVAPPDGGSAPSSPQGEILETVKAIARHLGVTLALLLVAFLSTGCAALSQFRVGETLVEEGAAGAWRALTVGGGAATSSLVEEGFEASPPVEVGVALPLYPAGSREPVTILCPTGDVAERCKRVPEHAQVKVTVKLVGGLLVATRVRWEGD